jgi:hypothetical protein
MPYDAPLYDLVAAHYAVHPDSGFFDLSAPGNITVADDGAMKFAPGTGPVKSLSIVAAKKTALIATATEKPMPPVNGRAGARGGRGSSGFPGRRGAPGVSGGRGAINLDISK